MVFALAASGCTGHARIRVWALVPFDVETVRPTSEATIRSDASCRFEASIRRDDAIFLSSMPIDPDPLFASGIEPRAEIAGLAPDSLYVGACGDVHFGNGAGWVPFADFSRLRRVVYELAESARCHIPQRAAQWPWHRRCPQAGNGNAADDQ